MTLGGGSGHQPLDQAAIVEEVPELGQFLSEDTLGGVGRGLVDPLEGDKGTAIAASTGFDQAKLAHDLQGAAHGDATDPLALRQVALGRQAIPGGVSADGDRRHDPVRQLLGG